MIIRSAWKLRTIPAIIIISVLLGSCGASDPEPGAEADAGKVYKLRAVTMLAREDFLNAAFFEFVDRVNKGANGRLIIDYVGGPEAVPPGQLVSGMAGGIYDLGVYGASLLSQSPEAVFIPFSELAPWEERANGYFDRINASLSGVGIYYLGKANWPLRQQIYSRTPIRSLADFKGKKFYASKTYAPFLQILGATDVGIPPADIYGALDQGVIDGVVSGRGLAMAFSWHEVQKFMLQPTFSSPNLLICINLRTLEMLPEDLQELVKRTAEEVERDMATHFTTVVEQKEAAAINAGVQITQLPDAEAEQFLAMFGQSARQFWENTMQAADPEVWELTRDSNSK